MRISIFGLGYVGSVSMVCLAWDGHDLVGVDVDQSKLDLIRSGCGIGSWGGQRPRLGGYVTGTGSTPGRPSPEGVHVAYPLGYPSRKEFLQDYRRRTAWVRGLSDRVVPG